jgi:hypothetical protein
MTPLARHLILPGVAVVLFGMVAATPVEVLGCRNRGLLAFVIALASGLGGVGAALLAVVRSARKRDDAGLAALAAVVAAIPVVALLLLA